ncbi:KTSC domain-containing protein [Mesorhizobium sp. M0074]|uniref:hypothetical protein n=1 Tax=unclassified Mesorhizobium TaxID=325217 RepID=UPI0033373397
MEYDLDRRTLSVWFVASGKRYEFEGVPPETLPRSGPRSPRAAISTTTSATISATVWLRAIATRDDLTCRRLNRPVAPTGGWWTRCRCCA